jgi:hypothetical protein
MGFDTYVEVGDRTLTEYRKQSGDLPRFLFEHSDVVIGGGDEANPPSSVEFVTTAERALAVLDAQGLGWNASVAAYGAVRSGWAAGALLTGMYMAEARWGDGKPEFKEADHLARERVAQEGAATPESDLAALGQLLTAAWQDGSVEEPIFLHEFLYGDMPERSTEQISQVIDAAREASLDPLPPARAVETLAGLFQEARLVAWPILMTVFLSHLPSDTPVRYVLTEGIREFGMDNRPAAEAYIEEYWRGTGESIADYARNLGVLFGVLADFEGRLGAQYWFGRAIAALDHLEALNADRSKSTKKERGDALERLMEAVFNAEGPELTVAEKNFSTREEEIDLVLRSNLPEPFWGSQNSPFWFVECKNWAAPVGVSEIRNFESKMDDRRSTVRVGVFVSAGGFYSTAVDRLKAAQTKNIGLIYAITLEDVRGLIGRRQTLSNWLLNEGAMRAFGGTLLPIKDS